MIHLFEPKILNAGMFGEIPSETEIKNEPMLYSASLEFAMKNGGNITKHMLMCWDLWISLSRIEIPKGVWVIDSRVHMLMPGMYPAIPGWHLDACPRIGNNPDFSKASDNADHFVCTVGTSDSRTEYLLDDIAIEYPTEEELKEMPVYGWANRHINSKKRESWKPENGAITGFSGRTWHRATQSTNRGWRWFIRVSRYPVGYKPMNEIRNQVQVYTTERGW